VAKAHGVKLAGVGTQLHLDVAQALAQSKLGKVHDTKLLGASQASRASVAAVALNGSRKAFSSNECHNLRKLVLADIHGKSS